MWPFLILGGIVAALALSSKPSTSALATTSPGAGGATPAGLAAFQQAQAFNAAAQAAGLTPDQAQQAYLLGVTPAAYAQTLAGYQQNQLGQGSYPIVPDPGVTGANGGLSQPGDPATMPPATTGAPLLAYHGERHPRTGQPIYRCASSGVPVMFDSLGCPWYFGPTG